MTQERRAVRLVCLVAMSLSLFGCDHATKIAAKATLAGAAALPIAPAVFRGALELRYAANDDVAFSALHRLQLPQAPGVIVAISVAALVAIVAMAVALWRRRKQSGEPEEPSAAVLLTQAGFALVVGGALGNVVDRIARGYVVDFIHVKGWPIFNLADIAVVVGAGLMMIPRLARRRARR